MSLCHPALGPGHVRAAASGGDQPPTGTTTPRAPRSQQISIELAGTPKSVALARALVVDLLRRHGHQDVADVADVASLLTSEIVTNAVVHGSTSVRLHASLTEVRLRVEAVDESEQLPVTRTQWPDATDGRGLIIVASLATAWGYEPRATGKAVWFELGL